MKMDLKEITAALQQRLEPTLRIREGVIESSGGEAFLDHTPGVVCADGFEMSVQASRYHYCTPRNSNGPWVAVEVGFPSAKVDAFMPFIDGSQDDDPTDTVYGYVPLEIVAQTIADHGGFAA